LEESRDTAGMTQRQASMVELWEKHMSSEFDTGDVDATMATMAGQPYLNHVPVMTGGVGHDGVRSFYARYFIGHHPGDTRVELVSRTVGESRIVDEMIHTFTHDIEMPWILPGVEPTGRRIEVPVVAIVEFEGGKIAHEHIYWDQASVLAQAGLLDATKLPVTGARQAHKVQDPELRPNELIDRAERV
jgi:carboxymethylenebutenolidase